ncbi:MAG: hypothetical protein GY733_03840 [bacterium]|nr:hypothetical protein [bacterium]
MSNERPTGSGGAGAACGIALVAFAVRVLPVRGVFSNGEIYLTDSDAYYHLRRIVYDLARFPSTLEHDAYLNFPAGAKAIWPQTLDWLLAALLLPFGVADDPAAAERILVFVPPLLGAVTVFAAHRVAARQFDSRVANLAASILAVLPAHFWYSQIGFVDHHVAVSLCATLLLGVTLALVSRCEAEGAVWRGLAIGFGVLSAFSLMIWPGALLYVVLAMGSLLLLAALSVREATRMAALGVVWWAAAVALLVIAPMSLGNEWPQWGSYSAVVLSRFQPWLFASLALHAWLVSALFERGFDRSVASRFFGMVGIGIVLLVACFLLLPGLDESVRDSIQWLGRGDAFQGLVGESVPLFVLHGEFTTRIASSRLSFFVYLFPFACLWLAFAWRDDARRSEHFVLLGWAVVLFAFTLLQKRFFNTFGVTMALVMAVSLGRVLGRRQALVAVASIALLAPSLAVYLGPIGGITDALRGREPEPNHRIEVNRARRALTKWLREHTPQTSGFLDTGATPEYGVLARWGDGHFITYSARRPSVMGNFGDDLGREHFLLARSFFAASPARASEILEQLRVRYVVIRSMSESREMARQLFLRDGARLGRYRLVHEVRPMAGVELPAYKVFEFVKGAELVGRAPPRALVRAELELTTNLARITRYEVVGEADSEGRYRLRLAHPTAGTSAGVETASHYRIRVGDLEATLAVPLAAVREGAEVPGPRF